MDEVPGFLQQRIKAAGQEHVLRWWHALSEKERETLVSQLSALDFDLLNRLYAERDRKSVVPAEERLAPITATQVDTADRAAGEEALRHGEVAVLIVAGGQGSRLGFDHPKGMYPIGPVRGTTLFQILAEKALAISRRYAKPIPFLVMTSAATHDETVEFFEQDGHFGLPKSDVVFFRQGTMPALDLGTGRLLMESRGSLFLSPNGHGGTLLALAEAGLLDMLSKRGIRHVFYCQVDNPLVRVADPAFIGHHLRASADVSTKVIAKKDPLEKVGNLALIDGRCGIIEYSDLPDRLARQTDEDGRLRFRLGNAAIHVFDVGFLKRMTESGIRSPESGLTFHTARKKVPYLNEQGEIVEPDEPNALKFEMFIFDALLMAKRWTLVEINPAEEFHPLKNATGADSPDTVKQAMSNVAGGWLEQAGAFVSRQSNGNVSVPLEISPLLALEASDLQGKVNSGTRIADARYFA
jgi:UDP-N-acetylglucosamine/UDP-N-acetylgalactosamine diphosphorylase